MLEPRGYEWTRSDSVRRLLRAGDVAWFRLIAEDSEGDEPVTWLELVQEPELEGAVVLLESATGAVRAMVGGRSYSRFSPQTSHRDAN